MSDQLDVHRNPGRNRRIPYVVVVQSNRFRDANTRIIVPLITVDTPDNQESDVSPVFEIEGNLVVLAPLQITNVRCDILGPVVASLADEDSRVTGAIDAAISRAWR